MVVITGLGENDAIDPAALPSAKARRKPRFLLESHSMSGRGIGISKLAAVALVAGGLGACAVVPETGRTQFNLISPSQERSLGQQAFVDVRRKLAASTDRNATEMVRRVGQRIADVANLPQAKWDFVLFQNAEPNAFCLPGGKVGVYSGILPITKDEAGLATVIAHEVAHAVAHHGAEQMSEQMLWQGLGTAVFSSLSQMSEGARQLLYSAYGLGTLVGRTLPHSRMQEMEADGIGLIYMARAGYDPEEAVLFWRRFAEYKKTKGGASKVDFLSTHPLDEQRIANLQKLMPKARLQYRPR